MKINCFSHESDHMPPALNKAKADINLITAFHYSQPLKLSSFVLITYTLICSMVVAGISLVCNLACFICWWAEKIKLPIHLNI